MKRYALISLFAFLFLIAGTLSADVYAWELHNSNKKSCCSNHQECAIKVWIPGHWERKGRSIRKVWVPGYWEVKKQCNKCTSPSIGKGHKKHPKKVAKKLKKHDKKSKFEISIRLPGWYFGYSTRKLKPYHHYKPYCHLH